MHREHLPETKSREASTLERNQNCFFLFSRFLIFACPYCKQETVLRVFGAVCAEIRTTGFKLFSPQTPLCVAGRLGRGEKRAHRPSRACYLFIIAILLNTQAAIAQCLSNHTPIANHDTAFRAINCLKQIYTVRTASLHHRTNTRTAITVNRTH